MEQKSFTICVVGGTGTVGSGLALRWAHSGHRVMIGSRDEGKAKKIAGELNAMLGAEHISGVA
ncbi:MAG: NAD(P)-binding domain-containing protein, partial [Pseudomonadota bacterium]